MARPTDLPERALTVPEQALVARGAASAPTAFAPVITAPSASDLAKVVDGDGPRLHRSDAHPEPAVVRDPTARLLLRGAAAGIAAGAGPMVTELVSQWL